MYEKRGRVIVFKNEKAFTDLGSDFVVVKFKELKWMKEANKGKEPPEWMSTHPSTSRRIEQIGNWIPGVILEYPPIKI